MLCFEHIPKTAGTSLTSAFQIHYGKNALNLSKDSLNTIPSNIELIYSHRAKRTALKSGINNLQMLTFVRHPVSLVKSHFMHLARSSDVNFIQINLMRKTLEDYLKQKTFKDFDNGLVRRFSNIDFPYGECNEDYLKVAIKNLDSYVFIGVQEFFNESIFSMSKFLNWNSYPIYIKSNKIPAYQRKITGFDELIIENSAFDIKLYNYCLDKFEKVFNLSNIYDEEFLAYMKLQEKFNKNFDAGGFAKKYILRDLKNKIKGIIVR